MRRSCAFSLVALVVLVGCRPDDVLPDGEPPLVIPSPAVAAASLETLSRMRVTPLSHEEANVVAQMMVYLVVHRGTQSVALIEHDLASMTGCSIRRSAFQLVRPDDRGREARRVRKAFADEIRREAFVVGVASEPMDRGVLHLVIGLSCATEPAA